MQGRKVLMRARGAPAIRATDATRAMLTLAALVVAPPLAAQRIETLTLPPAVETHPHEFTGITSLRELSDGRVIVTDGGEQRILVLDFANQTSKEIGREGRGPEEYGAVHFVFPIGADSSIMVDMPGMRFGWTFARPTARGCTASHCPCRRYA